jgi:hypothetical protein
VCVSLFSEYSRTRDISDEKRQHKKKGNHHASSCLHVYWSFQIDLVNPRISSDNPPQLIAILQLSTVIKL